jgi:tetratricopeptide (TPR) repeat protein
VTFQGNLKSLCLFDVFQNVMNNRLTGTLLLQIGKEERMVHFEEGKVAMVSLGRGVGMPMKEFLVRRGWVTPEDLDRVQRKRGTSRIPLPDLLEKQGVLPRDHFARAAEDHQNEFLYELLLLKEADYEFEEGPPPKGCFDLVQKTLRLAVDPGPILVEAARREDEWVRIHKVISSERDLFVGLGDGEVELAEDQAAIWTALDGRTELIEFESLIGQGYFEVCSIICDLVEWGLSRPVNPAELKQLAGEAIENEELEKAADLLEHCLEIERANPELRTQLAGVLEELGRNSEAAQTWAILGLRCLREDEEDDALEAFQRAASLDPEDVGLYERIYECLERTGSIEDFTQVALDLSTRYEELGLLDKAIEVLVRSMGRPDLSQSIALLEPLISHQKQAGKAEEGLATLLSHCDEADRAGDRERALEILEIGERIYPDSVEVQGRRADIHSFKREQRQAKIRRIRRIAAGVLLMAGAIFVCKEEWILQAQLRQYVRELPLAFEEGRSLELLEDFRSERKSPWPILSSFLAAEFETAVLSSESRRIIEAARSGRYADKDVNRLAALYPAGKRSKIVDETRSQVSHWRKTRGRFSPWFPGGRGVGAANSGKAFSFEAVDVAGVLELYPRLAAEGRKRMRDRLAQLKSVEALPVLVSHALLVASKSRLEKGSKPRLLIEQLSKKARNSSLASERKALHAAYRLLEDQLFGGQPQRARQLLPSLLPEIKEPPKTREEFRAYIGS